jgi:PKD repeat protein
VTFISESYDADGEIINYTWDFGAGTYVYTENTTYKFDDDGTYVVKLKVTDNGEASNEIEKEITISNIEPVALFSMSAEKPREDEKVTFNASESFDQDGTLVNYSWDFDSDGIIDAYGIEVEFRYKDKRDYVATLTVTDDDGDTDDFQLVLTVREKERIPGFELLVIVIASTMLIFMKRFRKGIWRL